MNYKLYALLFLSVLTVYSCSTSRQAAQLVREVATKTNDVAGDGTLYLSSQHFDSVFVFRDRQLDRSRDTVYLKDSILEYRYRLLRDTVYQTRVDSIPVLREVEVVREVRHIPWYAKLLSWIGTLALLFLLIRVILYLRGR